MCFSLMTSVGQYYMVFYLTNVAKMSLASVAFITAGTATLDAFTSWIYGAIINSTKPMKWGRYRSWLIAFTWLIPIFYFFQFFRIGTSEGVAVVFFFIFQYGARFVHNFPYIANTSLIPIVAKNADERVMMASSRATWNNMSKFAWSYMGVPFLAILTSALGEEYSYGALAAILACFTVFTYWIHFKMTDGYEDTGSAEKASVAKTKRAKTNAKDLLIGLFANPPLIALLIADLAKWMFNFIVAGTVVYYFTYIALDRGMMATYMLIVAFLAVIGALGSRYVGKLLSGRITIIVAYLIMAAALLIGRADYTNATLVIVMISIAQLGYGMSYACSTALYGDTAVYSEWKSGKNASGWILGLQNIPLKVGSALRNIVLTAALAASGFNAKLPVEEATTEVKEGICFALMVLPAIFLIVGAVVLLIGFRLPKSKLEQMQKEIAEKKAQELAAEAAKPAAA
jgi:GPH family glycoside/pentoside/hexuronide:cation symporter